MRITGAFAALRPIAGSAPRTGFNEDWIDFEGGSAKHRTARIPLASVLRELAADAKRAPGVSASPPRADMLSVGIDVG